MEIFTYLMFSVLDLCQLLTSIVHDINYFICDCICYQNILLKFQISWHGSWNTYLRNSCNLQVSQLALLLQYVVCWTIDVVIVAMKRSASWACDMAKRLHQLFRWQKSCERTSPGTPLRGHTAATHQDTVHLAVHQDTLPLLSGHAVAAHQDTVLLYIRTHYSCKTRTHYSCTSGHIAAAHQDTFQLYIRTHCNCNIYFNKLPSVVHKRYNVNHELML